MYSAFLTVCQLVLIVSIRTSSTIIYHSGCGRWRAMKAISLAGNSTNCTLSTISNPSQSHISLLNTCAPPPYAHNRLRSWIKTNTFPFPQCKKTELSFKMAFGCNTLSRINLWKWRSPAKSSLFHFNTKVTVLWPFCVIFHPVLPYSMKKCDIWKQSPVWLNWRRFSVCFAVPQTSVVNERGIRKSPNYYCEPHRIYLFFFTCVKFLSYVLLHCAPSSR